MLTTGETILASLIQPWLNSPHVRIRPAVEVEAKNGEVPRDAVTPAIPAVVCDGTVTLEDIERETIIATLKHNRGHRQRSASALGIGVRTLGLKLKKWKEQNLVSPSL